MKVRYSSRAVRDLAAIGHYLRKRSLAGAPAVENKIKSTIGILTTFPEGGRIVAERPHVRVLPVVRYPYLIFYTVLLGELVILHIRHGARRPVTPEEL